MSEDTIREKFSALIGAPTQGGCLPWLGGKSFPIGMHRSAHPRRVAWVLANCEIPQGHWVWSNCGNKWCVNPEHLRLCNPQSLAERLERYTYPEPNTGCFLWGGAISGSGYGSVKVGDKIITAHRAAWIAKHGSVPQELDVLHTCDVRSCVNPDHLFLGTASDNMFDCSRKGRANKPQGEAAYNAKLTNDDVIDIRLNRHISSSVYAERLGISKTTVKQARKGDTWRHILTPSVSGGIQ